MYKGLRNIYETLQGGALIMSRTYGHLLVRTNAPRTKYASAGYYTRHMGKEMNWIQATNMLTMHEEAEPKEPSQISVNDLPHKNGEIRMAHPSQKNASPCLLQGQETPPAASRAGIRSLDQPANYRGVKIFSRGEGRHFPQERMFRVRTDPKPAEPYE